MNIGLIDVDGHNFPNFALMRLSAWHKAHGDSVEWADAMFGVKGLIAVFGYIIRSKSLAMSKKIHNFAIANKMIVNYPEWATVIAQRVWAIFMPLLYPHTAVSLRKIKPFGVYHLVSSANDTAFCVCNPSKTR